MYLLIDLVTGMYVNDAPLPELVAEPYPFRDANTAMHAGIRVLEANKFQAPHSLELRSVSWLGYTCFVGGREVERSKRLGDTA